MGSSLAYTRNVRYKCFLCEVSKPNKYDVRRHFNKAHPRQPYNINKLVKLSVGGEQSVAAMRKRTLPRQSAEALEDANEEEYDYDDENYDGDGPPPSKLRRLLPYETIDSSMFPTPDTPAASQSLSVDESSEPQYDPRLILSKEASNDSNLLPELHIEIKKAIARTKEATEQTAASTIDSLNKKLETSLTANRIHLEEIARLKADVKARDHVIEFMRERLRKVKTGRTL